MLKPKHMVRFIFIFSYSVICHWITQLFCSTSEVDWYDGFCVIRNTFQMRDMWSYIWVLESIQLIKKNHIMN